jgi:hypothetical protein
MIFGAFLILFVFFGASALPFTYFFTSGSAGFFLIVRVRGRRAPKMG